MKRRTVALLSVAAVLIAILIVYFAIDAAPMTQDQEKNGAFVKSCVTWLDETFSNPSEFLREYTHDGVSIRDHTRFMNACGEALEYSGSGELFSFRMFSGVRAESRYLAARANLDNGTYPGGISIGTSMPAVMEQAGFLNFDPIRDFSPGTLWEQDGSVLSLDYDTETGAYILTLEEVSASDGSYGQESCVIYKTQQVIWTFMPEKNTPPTLREIEFLKEWTYESA